MSTTHRSIMSHQRDWKTSQRRKPRHQTSTSASTWMRGRISSAGGGVTDAMQQNELLSSIAEGTTASNSSSGKQQLQQAGSSPAPAKKQNVTSIVDDISAIIEPSIGEDGYVKQPVEASGRLSPQHDTHVTAPSEMTVSTVTDYTESPIIYTYRKDGPDDDTISQITSSLAGSSYQHYHPSVPFMSSNVSGALRSSGRTRGGIRLDKKQGTVNPSNAGQSVVDSLDEIASILDSDTLKDNNAQRKTADVAVGEVAKVSNMYEYRPRTSIGNGSGSGGGNEGRPSDRSRYRRSFGDDYASNGSQGSRSKTGITGASKTTNVITKMQRLRHFLIRLLLPNSSAVMKRKKHDEFGVDDDEFSDDGDKDYFAELMRPNFVRSGPKMTKAQKRRAFLHNLFKLSCLFGLMTALLLGLRLATLHGLQGQNGPRELRWSSLTVIGPGSADDAVVRGRSYSKYGIGSDKNRVLTTGRAIRASNAGRGNSLSDPADPMALSPRPAGVHSTRHIGMAIPDVFEGLADVTDHLGDVSNDVPFFWHIPRTGGTTMNDILGSCLHLTLASNAGGEGGHGTDETLRVLDVSREFSYVNVDTSSVEGIKRAKRLDLLSSGMADVVISPLLHEASSIFTPLHRGRMFTLFRHPVERAVSLFYYLQDTQWQNKVSMEEYFKSGHAENNWVTRFLTNQLTKGVLTSDDLDVAKEVVRRKCLVGLLKEKSESFERFEKFLGWALKSTTDQECQERLLEWAWPLKHRHDGVKEGTEMWELIVAQNEFDLQLFQYAELLFQEQGHFFE